MPHTKRWLATLAAILLVLVAAAAGLKWWQEASPPPAADLVRHVRADAARSCASTEIVGLRGHGDPPGMGADVLALALRIEAALPRGAVATYALPYAQAPTAFGFPVSVLRDLGPGADLLVDYVDQRARACPREEEVVIGQSEGAAIVHLARPRIAARVAATVLFGDPLHVSGAAYDQRGSAAGEGQFALWMGIGRPPYLDGTADPIGGATAARVRSYCLADDRVCDFNLLDTNPDEHLQYRHDRPLVAGGPGVLDLALSFVTAGLTKNSLG